MINALKSKKTFVILRFLDFEMAASILDVILDLSRNQLDKINKTYSTENHMENFME